MATLALRVSDNDLSRLSIVYRYENTTNTPSSRPNIRDRSTANSLCCTLRHVVHCTLQYIPVLLFLGDHFFKNIKRMFLLFNPAFYMLDFELTRSNSWDVGFRYRIYWYEKHIYYFSSPFPMWHVSYSSPLRHHISSPSYFQFLIPVWKTVYLTWRDDTTCAAMYFSTSMDVTHYPSVCLCVLHGLYPCIHDYRLLLL